MKIIYSLSANISFFLFIIFVGGCKDIQKNTGNEKGTFGYDLNFLKKHQETIVLKNGDAMLAVCPAYQGRVMTSTSGGENGLSFGWLNYDLIASGETLQHINPVGGEDRFWLGPEGGQFSIFFKKGDQFNLEDWQTPASIDTDTYKVVSSNDRAVSFEQEFEIENYSGTSMKLKVDRNVSLLSNSELQSIMNIGISDNLKTVAYRSLNTITNKGDKSWDKESGALTFFL